VRELGSGAYATVGTRGLHPFREPRRDVALAEAFLRASLGDDDVVAVNEAVIMATAGAASLVTAADHVALWTWARAPWTSTGISSLESRPDVSARCVPVCSGAQLVGALVILEGAAAPGHAPHGDECCSDRSFESALPGGSALARHTREQLVDSSLRGVNTVITGEPGTGKTVTGRQLLSQVDHEIVEFDAACSRDQDWILDVTTALRVHSRVLLTHLDEVAPRIIPALADALGDRRRDCWVVATAAQPGVPEPLALAFPKTVMLPALRDRLEDLPVIAARLLSRHSRRGYGKRLHPEARRLLWSHSWPDNIAELELVLSRAVVAANTAVIDAHCIRLPKDAAALGRRRSAVEAAERFAVLDALGRCEGNKLAAADLLGIARSTLYRKLRALGIVSEVDPDSTADATA
jgi:hypothetical protein